MKSNSNINKYIISGIVGMLIYQQLQNIGMTFGLMPITGITLPFISYGGSSLLSYMIMIGIIFNISNQALRNINFNVNEGEFVSIIGPSRMSENQHYFQ